MTEREIVAAALEVLGVDRLVLSLQDASFPASDAGDLGRGSPYSPGAARFLAYVRALGFTGIQFGPQGLQDEGSASPYEATAFSRNPLNVSAAALIDEGLLTSAEVDEAVSAAPPGSALRADHLFAHRTSHALLARAFERARRRTGTEAWTPFARNHAAWLEPDALYDALCLEHRDPWWRTWGGGPAALDQALFSPPAAAEDAAKQRRAALLDAHRETFDRYAFAQWVLHRQHQAMRATLRGLGLNGYGDLQVGLSARDEWASQRFMLPGYRMGAPPSRTNPEGQPWNYPVLDPAHYGEDAHGPAGEYLRARVRKLLDEHDGLRIDHPHGIVCPWVYRGELPDPLAAVQGGARLFSSPDLPDHPALARYSLVSADELDPSLPRYADEKIPSLTPAQIARFSILIDAVMDEAARHGSRDHVLGEVLSTMPSPLREAFARHRLGRFRVTQKANLADPRDVYRTENAQPADWVMLGNHDTPPIWRVIPGWRANGRLEAQARELARKLEPDEARRPEFTDRVLARTGALAEAMLADALASPARQVQIFFADLFGLEEVFNTPGTVSPENWRLRVPSDHALVYPLDRRKRRALNLPGALAMAIRSRGAESAVRHADLISKLDALAEADQVG